MPYKAYSGLGCSKNLNAFSSFSKGCRRKEKKIKNERVWGKKEEEKKEKEPINPYLVTILILL